jgi:O-antigen ligase
MRRQGNSTLGRAVVSDYLWVVLLVLCVVQFTSAWLYPPIPFGSTEGIILTKQFGVPFQYGLWALVAGCLAAHVSNAGISRLVDVLLPFGLFFLVGVCAATFGFDPLSSYRILAQWLVMALAATAIGQQLPAERTWRVLLVGLLFLMAASAVLALAVPARGTQAYGYSAVWRGVFTNKNQLGWIAALTLVASASLSSKRVSLLSVLTFSIALACLIGSGSKGALLGALAALGYRPVIAKLVKSVSSGLGILLVLWGVALLIFIGVGLLPVLLDLLHRDPTLTGRTEIWQLYFNSMMNTPWLGQGPGAYTATSSVTLPLAQQLGQNGAIVTPHNGFLGAFGDAGVAGLLTFAGLLLYISVVAPFRRPSTALQLSASIGVLMIILGMVETHDVFAAGPGWFILILSRSAAFREPEVALASTEVPVAQSSSSLGAAARATSS